MSVNTKNQSIIIIDMFKQLMYDKRRTPNSCTKIVLNNLGIIFMRGVIMTVIYKYRKQNGI